MRRLKYKILKTETQRTGEASSRIRESLCARPRARTWRAALSQRVTPEPGEGPFPRPQRSLQMGQSAFSVDSGGGSCGEAER